MAPGIGAGGIIGIAFEATPGVYVAPTKYVPIKNETLYYNQAKSDRRVIRQVADSLGVVLGDEHVSGDINMELLPDCAPYFMYASRVTVIKTGAGPYTYTGTPNHGALPSTGRTLSITCVRNGVVHGYTGCAVGVTEISTDDGTCVVRYGIVGRNEATQSAPTPTWPTSVPFGKGMYDIEIPLASDVLDVDTFTFTVDDGLVPEFRLGPSRNPSFVRYGERQVSLTLARDFENRTDFDAFKAGTAQAIKIQMANGASADIRLDIPVSIKDTYEHGLSGQGDLVRASIAYKGHYDATTTAAAKYTMVSAENIT